MSLVNIAKVEAALRQAQDSGKRMVGAFFKSVRDEAARGDPFRQRRRVPRDA
jgi:hypothetical protein